MEIGISQYKSCVHCSSKKAYFTDAQRKHLFFIATNSLGQDPSKLSRAQVTAKAMNQIQSKNCYKSHASRDEISVGVEQADSV
jgi:hypothetical protein